jgi:hypothetical protein
MNRLRVNYLFSEEDFEDTRELYRIVLWAACKEASRRASTLCYYRRPLTDYINAFDLDALLRHMPIAQTSMPGQLTYRFPLVEVIKALRWLHDAGYLTVDRELEEIQLETHLFKLIADAWAVSLGVRRFNLGTPWKPIYTNSADRAAQIEKARIGREIRLGKEVIAA